MDKIYNKKYYRVRSALSRRIKKIFSFSLIIKLIDPQKNDSILEIGCEKGDLVEVLSKDSQKVVGVDINRDAIEQLHKENLFCMSAENLEFPDSSFDKVVSSHTIEHVPDLKKFFTEIERVLKPKGRCILVYPLELIRGITAFPNAWAFFGNPFKAGKIHLHRLWPAKLKKFTNMKIIKKGIFFRPIALDFYTIFQKA